MLNIFVLSVVKLSVYSPNWLHNVMGSMVTNNINDTQHLFIDNMSVVMLRVTFLLLCRTLMAPVMAPVLIEIVR